MKYKFKIIDILLIAMIFVTIGDFKQGYILAGVLDTIIIVCNIAIRLRQIKQYSKEI